MERGRNPPLFYCTLNAVVLSKMMVSCMICGKSFKQITLTHLKSHNTTVEQYRIDYPDAELLSMASRLAMREKATKQNASRKGVKRSDKDMAAIREGIAKAGPRVAHNKGMACSDEAKKNISEKAKAAYANGDRQVSNYERTPEIRQKISTTLTGRTLPREQVEKAKATRKQNAKPAPFLGKKHSEETKQKISEQMKLRCDGTRITSRQYMLSRIEASNLILRNGIEESVFELQCAVCDYEFTRTPQVFTDSKFHGEICDQCYPLPTISVAEKDIFSIFEGHRVFSTDRQIISPLELDIVLPDNKLAIEYCGLYWHSEIAGKTRYYHRKKHDLCVDAGYRLITIFEDEWLNNPKIVRSMLLNSIGGNQHRINARSCKVAQISSTEGRDFIRDNHIQGGGRANVYYGLYFENELISVMSFSNNEISRKTLGWDINRFCSKLGFTIRGGAGKLFSAFVRDHDPECVISYADLRWGTGRVYGQLGFEFIGNTVPNYWYFRPNEMRRIHRYGLRKTDSDDQSKTEWENRQEQGWNRIWDCGHAKWEWHK